MLTFTKRRALLLGAVATLALAGIAFAYWTAGGSGTGSASAAASTNDLTVVQTTSLTPMYPGDSAQTIAGKFNNSNSGPVYVDTVTASISDVTQAAGATGSCDATDFTLASAAMTVGHEVPAGTGVDSFTGATIRFNDKAANQDGCKGATVELTYTVS
jgi:ABC-type glycerol-3-phosphate transport system substrate-binding protein